MTRQDSKQFPPTPSSTLELTVLGWSLLCLAVWELFANRLAHYLGFYAMAGSQGVRAWLAVSGYYAMVAAGVITLVLFFVSMLRLMNSVELPGLWWRGALIIFSPIYLLVIAFAIFQERISGWLLLFGYLSAVLTVMIVGLVAALRPMPGGVRRLFFIMGLICGLQGFQWTLREFIEVEPFSNIGMVAMRAYNVAELLAVIVPIFAFFSLSFESPRQLGAYLRRPHLGSLALGACAAAAGVWVVIETGEEAYLVQVAYAVFGVSLSIPIGIWIYMVSLFFAGVVVGKLLIPSRAWPTTPASQRLGMGLALLWMAGLQPFRVYQFAFMLLGFVLAVLGAADRYPLARRSTTKETIDDHSGRGEDHQSGG